MTGHRFLLSWRENTFPAPGNLRRMRAGKPGMMLCCQWKAQKLAGVLSQGSGRKKPWTLSCCLVRLVDVKKKPLPRINGERKKRMSGAGPSGKWERGDACKARTSIFCLSPCKPMIISRLFKVVVTWTCVQIVKIIPVNLPKVKVCEPGRV